MRFRGVLARYPLVHGTRRRAPFDGGFDLAISEYGASIWCDPYRWIPQAARLLRPGGRPLSHQRRARDADVPDEDGGAGTDRWYDRILGCTASNGPGDPVEFHISHGDMIPLLATAASWSRDLLEVRPPDGASTRYPFVTLDWAQRWPCEEVWKARKRC